MFNNRYTFVSSSSLAIYNPLTELEKMELKAFFRQLAAGLRIELQSEFNDLLVMYDSYIDNASKSTDDHYRIGFSCNVYACTHIPKHAAITKKGSPIEGEYYGIFDKKILRESLRLCETPYQYRM